MMDMIVVEMQKQTQLTNTEENAHDDCDEDDKLQKEMDVIDQQHEDMKKRTCNSSNIENRASQPTV